MVRIVSSTAVALAVLSAAPASAQEASVREQLQLNQACRQQCEDYRSESSSAPTCSKWNRTLPRPKVGRTCQDAFDTMFKTTCLNYCHNKETTYDVNSHCSAARKEMPKPVVGKACNEGYKGGFDTAKALFTDEAEEARQAAKEAAAAAEREASIAAQKAVEAAAAAENAKKAEEAAVAAAATTNQEASTAAAEEAVEEGGLRGGAAEEEEDASDLGAVVATLPVTVDESDINLVIHEKQEPLEAVTAFCNKHMASAGSACMDQLLPHVERKLSEKGISN